MGEYSIEQPPVYEDGGVVYYRASALGHCVRMLALARQGYDALPPPAQMQKVYDAGHEAERQVFMKGIVKGLAQHTILLPISDSIVIRGHLDAWTPERIYEVKSQSPDEFGVLRDSHLWEPYSYQVSVYMHATKLPCTVVRVMRDKDGNISEREEETFDVPPVAMDQIRSRVFKVESLARRDLSGTECEKREWPCPFFYTHVGAKEDIREYVEDRDAVILVRQYCDAKTIAQVAKGRLDKSREAIIDWMGDRDKVELPEGWRVTRYKVEGKEVKYTRSGYTSIKITQKETDGQG